MMRVKVRWSGFIGSPGWSNFYFDGPDGSFLTPEDAGPAADRVATFLTAIRGRFPIAVNWNIQSDVEYIGETDGELLNVHSAGARAAITGGATAAPYSAATGAVITWRTAGVVRGRRVRGRTFLVPTANHVYANDGTLESTIQTEFLNAATALADQANPIKLGIWSRPTIAGAQDGSFHPVTSASVPDMAAVLRSRRD
jgi:hypothetical protein